MFKVIMCRWNLTEFAVKKFNFTFSVRNIPIIFRMFGKLIFTKACGIKQLFFSLNFIDI